MCDGRSCTSFTSFTLGLNQPKVKFLVEYSVIIWITLPTIVKQKIILNIKKIYHILINVCDGHFNYHPTWASGSEINFSQTFRDNKSKKNTGVSVDNFLVWNHNLGRTVVDLCAHYWCLKFFLLMSVTHNKNVRHTQNTLTFLFLHHKLVFHIIWLIPSAALVILSDTLYFKAYF